MVRTFVCVTLRLCPVYTKESKKRFELEREKEICVSISFWTNDGSVITIVVIES